VQEAELAIYIYIYHMYYIIMSTQTLLYVGLPHVKGFLMFLGIGPGADSDASHTVPSCSIMKWLGAVVDYCPKPFHYGTSWNGMGLITVISWAHPQEHEESLDIWKAYV
jgi:hypothetical protein